jgi:hypothetical protein
VTRRSLAIGAALALSSSVLLVNGAAADLIAHPAHVHVGSCPEVGDIVGPLSDVIGEGVPGSRAIGSAAAIPVEASVTSSVPLAYADLFATPHSVVVHRGPSDEDLLVYILCGDIGGHELGPMDIAIGLGELNASGYTGIATIHDNGDATIDVAVYITTSQAPMIDPAGSPAP